MDAFGEPVRVHIHQRADESEATRLHGLFQEISGQTPGIGPEQGVVPQLGISLNLDGQGLGVINGQFENGNPEVFFRPCVFPERGVVGGGHRD